MDATNFDRLTRAFSAAASRRTLLAGVTSGLLASLLPAFSPSETGARKKHKHKKRKKKIQAPQAPVPVQCPPTCPECQQCVNGQSCTALNGAVCQNNECKACQGGVCANNNGIDCGSSFCKECQGGQCVNKQNGANCNGTGKCIDGTCAPAPTCSPKASICIKTAHNCCSGDCEGTGATGTCGVSAEGEPCITNEDCNASIININFCGLDFKCHPIVIGPP
jgi:hypothetical protein